MGGTGKYAGIIGDLTITDEVFGSPATGLWQGAGHKKGGYKIVN